MPSSSASQEAAAWHMRLSRRSITTKELQAFRAWRRDKANAAAYAEMEATWSAAGQLAHDRDIQAATDKALSQPPPRATVAWFAVPEARTAFGMAAVLAAVGLGLFAYNAHTQQSWTTRVGEQRLVVLQDGSRVRLNTDSQVLVRYRRAERDLILARGEAFFEAAHDATRPFIVQAGDAKVRALGTRFDVRRDGEAVQVTLLEGKVHVRQDDSPAAAVLAPNQQLTVTAGGISPPRATDAATATSWTTGRLTFHDMALGEAIAEVNRYGARKIALAAPDLALAPVSGVFDTGDTDAFVSAVGMLFDLKAEPTANGGVRLVRATPSRAG